ncbi:ATP-binding protein [Pigmentiphaga litoralis]|uniref:ATP-binding protein n=1 Tax=Pigmentiphaga litoralis TaxID=516702 RepID=UPI003B43968E
MLNAGVLLNSMDDILRRALGETIELETVIAGGLWNVHVDRNQLENALLNLAINARDAMDGDGRITLETNNASLDDAYATVHEEVTPGQYVMIAVSDTGTGMSDDVMARAFEPFFTTKPDGKGSGLGLSMVYGFVKQSGGHLKIYSEIGHGSTIKMYLPRVHAMEDVSRPAFEGAATGAPKPCSSWKTIRPCARRPSTCWSNWATTS